MRRLECSESRRIASVESPSTEDREHLVSCRFCREYVLVERAMAGLAAEAREMPAMPSAEAILVRGKILERKRIAREAARPVLVFQKIAYGVIAICWLTFIAMQWTPLITWLGGLELSMSTGIEARGTLPLSFFWMFAVLSMMTMMTMVHGLWTEEPV